MIRVVGKAGSLAIRISAVANANNRVARVANSTAIKTAKRVANKGAASKVNRADKDARDVLALMASTDFKLTSIAATTISGAAVHCFIAMAPPNSMKNPWTKKNPFMSMWLSNANRIAGATRGRMTAEAKRAASTVMTEGARQMTAAWSDGLTAKRPAKRRKRR